MYSNYSIAGASVATPATVSVLPLDFPLGVNTEPLWLVLGGFAIFAALSAAKRVAPTWSQLVADSPMGAPAALGPRTRSYHGAHRANRPRRPFLPRLRGDLSRHGVAA